MSNGRCLGCDSLGFKAESMGEYYLCVECWNKDAGLERGRGGRILYVHPDGRREGARQRQESNRQMVAPRNPRKGVKP